MRVCCTIATLVIASTACLTKPDRPGSDAPADEVTPRVVEKLNGVTVNQQTMTFMMPVPAETPFLLAAVYLGANCGDSTPEVVNISVDGVDMDRLDAIVGTSSPNCTTGSRSEQWSLVVPPTGDAVPITFILSGAARTFHTVAMTVEGVDKSNPVRATASKSGRSPGSTLNIESAKGDLVIDTTGQGTAIAQPGPGQTLVFIMNNTAAFTLDNSAASSKPGDAGSTDMTWEFQLDDEFQTIATTLRPAP